MSRGGEGVHHGDQRRRSVRQAEADTRAAHVLEHERNSVTHRSHPPGQSSIFITIHNC